jgi:predicted Zn finger-like uncharacterized protein
MIRRDEWKNPQERNGSTMNVQCTHCKTVFRVDPAKVPEGGARARCSICRGVFVVPAAEGADVATGPFTASAGAEAAPARPAVPLPAEDAAARPAPPAPAPTLAPAPAAVAPAPAQRTAWSSGGAGFGVADPLAKARRLARALVSDIVTYHPERRDRAVEEGTVKREFMEEIKKSWEEYVAQVGPEMARSTPHFRDALNEILAKGQSVF